MKARLIAILWIASLCTAFYVGSRIGARENWLAESQYRAAIFAGRLRLLDENRLNDLRDVLEIQLDGELVDYGTYLDSRWKWLWPSLLPETPRAIASAAKYRASHPFSPPDLGDPKSYAVDDPSLREMLSRQQKENQQTLARVIAMYAQ